MAIISRINELVKFSGLSVRAFAIKCGIPQKTLDNQVKGLRGVSLETTLSILQAFPEVSANWLLKGEGEMLTGNQKDPSAERIEKLIGTIETLQESIELKNKSIAMLTERVKQLEAQIAR